MNRFLDSDPDGLGEYIQLKSDVCESAALVHSALLAEREPDEYFVEVNLSDAAVMDHSAKLPPEITQNLGAIESISMEFRFVGHADRPSVTVTVRDYLGNNAFAVKHENATPDTVFSQALVYNDFNPAAIEDVPANGFNALLAAVIYPNKDGDYSQFFDADMFDGDTARSLVESLKRRFETHEEVEYRIPELGCIVQGASFDEALHRLTVAYSLPRAQITQSTSGPGLETSILLGEDEPSVLIERIEDIAEPKHARRVEVSHDDLRLFKEILGDILVLHEQPSPVSLDRLNVIEQTKGSTRKLGFKALDDVSLDQDGLDTPDTSA